MTQDMSIKISCEQDQGWGSAQQVDVDIKDIGNVIAVTPATCRIENKQNQKYSCRLSAREVLRIINLAGAHAAPTVATSA